MTRSRDRLGVIFISVKAPAVINLLHVDKKLLTAPTETLLVVVVMVRPSNGKSAIASGAPSKGLTYVWVSILAHGQEFVSFFKYVLC